MAPRSTAADPPRWAQHGVLLVSVALVWHSLGDHGLFPPDEGRYAAVSGWMATHGNWFEPQLRDQLHVTKPPLAYWAQAVAQRVLGHTELAVRLPSALASTGILLATFWFARRACGAMAAMLAVGTLSAMPLFEVVGRLAITDPLLCAWWWGAVCCAWLAVGDRGQAVRGRWVAGFWTCCALTGMTKGPLVLAPPAIVAAWLAASGRVRDARAFVPLAGLPLAVVPLGLVAYGFWAANPGRAVAIWRFEFVDRFTGGAHDDPWWLVPAAFALGLFPATAMLTLPGFNVPWSRAVSVVREGGLRSLLVLAVLLPLVGFSLLRGSSPTYLLPLAPPLAVLVGMMLARWVGSAAGDVPAGERLPDVRITAGIAMTAVGLGLPCAAAVVVARGAAPGWAPGGTLVWLSLAAVPAMAGWWLAMAWWRAPSRRLPALGACFLGMAVTVVAMHRAEDEAMRSLTPRHAADAVRARSRPAFAFELNNLAIDWYLGEWLGFSLRTKDLEAWMTANPGGSVVMDERILDRLARTRRATADRLRVVSRHESWPARRVVVCEVAGAAD